jgi:hypothetical protein
MMMTQLPVMLSMVPVLMITPLQLFLVLFEQQWLSSHQQADRYLMVAL